MRVLFVLRSDEFFRYVESILREFGRRGNCAIVVAGEPKAVAAATQGWPWCEVQPAQADDRSVSMVTRVLREFRNYVHWEAQGDQSDFVRFRRMRFLPRKVRDGLRLLHRLRAEWLLTSRLVRGGLAWIEKAGAPPTAVLRQVREFQPDLVFLTPVILPHSTEFDYIKACRRLGIPTVALVASWDNPTTRGTYLVKPDWILVWNEGLAGDLVRFHQIPRDKIITVGAPVFDEMFAGGLLTSRAEFARQAGLDPDRPYVLYAVSAEIGANGDETDVVDELSRRLQSRAIPGGVQILVRPHPKNRQGWADFAAPDVRIWSTPAFPNTRESLADLYNSLYHSAAVVGLNTSVFLEAAIADRPSLSLAGRRPRYGELLHFQHLVDGAFLDIVANASAAAERIAGILRGDDPLRDARREFVRRFIRPAGMEMPAGRVAAEAIERLAAADRAPLPAVASDTKNLTIVEC